MDDSLKDVVDDLVEDRLEEHKTPAPSFWKKVQTTIMMIAAIMISAGQFNDTKDIFLSVYEATLTHFTHSIEYELIEKVNVGSSMDYVKSIVGEPHVLKRSKLNNKLQFHYYSKAKYTLTLISADDRLVGYSVFTLEDGFSPKIPFAEQLGEKSLAQAHKETGAYSYDIGNLLYYIESQDLGKEQMFLTLIRGYVEYGAIAQEEEVNENYRKQLAKTIENLDEKATFAENEQALVAPLKKVRQAVFPNFYAITELEPVIIAEALLTRYEFQLFTKS
ncbi:MAG: hypothetical protein JKY81_11910 [Colwellia sp.]|nr:hypothetical protein [Colwellia sp.]